MIEIRGLAKTYADGTQALRGLDLDVGEGMLGVLGPNGAGKTTFLSMLVLALEPSSGRRIYDGLDAARPAHHAAIRRRIGYLPQDFAPIGQLTGREYLVHCARVRGVGGRAADVRRRADMLLEAVDLLRAADRRSREYSGGMRRRLGMAQALIHAPTLVVVDEPTAGLDPEERIRFRNLISDVAEQSAVLLSTHVVEDVEATCSRLAIIGRGERLFLGAPSELIRRVTGRLWEVPADAPPSGALVVSRRVGEDGAARVVELADDVPAGAAPRDATLEEAYSAFLAREGLAGEGAVAA